MLRKFAFALVAVTAQCGVSEIPLQRRGSLFEGNFGNISHTKV